MCKKTFLDRQIQQLIKKYKVKINLKIFENREKKLNNYVVFTMKVHDNNKKSKSITSREIGAMWREIADEEKMLYSKIAKRYGKKKKKAKKDKTKKNKKKIKKLKNMFCYEVETVHNVLKDVVVDGETYVIDCFKNIIQPETGKEIGFISNDGKIVKYVKINM